MTDIEPRLLSQIKVNFTDNTAATLTAVGSIVAAGATFGVGAIVTTGAVSIIANQTVYRRILTTCSPAFSPDECKGVKDQAEKDANSSKTPPPRQPIPAAALCNPRTIKLGPPNLAPAPQVIAVDKLVRTITDKDRTSSQCWRFMPSGVENWQPTARHLETDWLYRLATYDKTTKKRPRSRFPLYLSTAWASNSAVAAERVQPRCPCPVL